MAGRRANERAQLMPTWLPPALGAGCFIAVHYLFLRAASGRIGDALGALVLESAAAIGIALSFAVGLRGAALPPTKAGLAFAVASGLAVSAASILLFASLRRGGPVASTGTIVLGGGVALSALAAPWIFGESFTARRALGVALGIAAIAVLSGEGAAAP
jgi:bacterial/archaeal transporter family protein